MSLKYSKTHEWVNYDGKTAMIGITDYAQKSLGDVVFVELPAKGSTFKACARFGTIESTKAASELYSPITGEVVEINTQLINNPQWVNESAESKAWMLKVKVLDPTEIDGLMNEAVYAEFTAKETH